MVLLFCLSVQQRAPGKILFDLVCTHLNLIEGDYFGLEYQDHRKMTVKQDLASSRLTCNDSSAALLVSHIVQSEIGDFDEVQSRRHLRENKYIPDQEALEDKIAEFHGKHVGQTPAESDYQLLEVARRLEMYGVRLHPAKDREGTKINLAVAHTGILVLQVQAQETHSLLILSKGDLREGQTPAESDYQLLEVARRLEMYGVRLHPAKDREGTKINLAVAHTGILVLQQSSFQDTLEFLMASRNCCKVLWKICVEYHAFFRLFEEPKPKPKPVLFTRGSSFRFRKHSKIRSIASLSPKPTERPSEVPKQVSITVRMALMLFELFCTSASYTYGDQPDSSTKPSRQVNDAPMVAVCVEDTARQQRRSPSLKKSPQEDRKQERAAEDVDGGIRGKAQDKQQTEHPSTGPASRATRGSSSSIPYIDCSDIDSEYDVLKGRVTRSQFQTNDNCEDEPVISSGGDAANTHSASYTYGDQPDSSTKPSRQVNDAPMVAVCVEDTARQQRRSPSLKKSPQEDRKQERVAEDVDGGIQGKAQDKQQTEHSSTGPASRATRGSSSSIPYIDCSDIDSEYDVLKGLVTRSQSQTNDNCEDEPVISSGGGANTHKRDENLSKLRFRDSPPISNPPLNITEEFIDDDPANVSFYAGGTPQMPRHSTLVDEIFRGSENRSPFATPLMPGSKRSSPHANSFSRNGSRSYVEQNGHSSRSSRWEESQGYSPRSSPREERQQSYGCNSYGNCSPMVSKAHLPKLQNARNRSDTDPFILSHMTSTPTNNHRPGSLSKAQRMAALERRVMANGLSSPGQSKASPAMKRLYASGAMDHVGAVQMIDCSTSSGSESTDSESEPPFSHPLMFGNPNAVSSSPMPRNKYSFGSLQLDEEVEEDGSINLSDEDGGRVFSCSVANSPRLSEMSVNSHGGFTAQRSILSPCLSPDGRQPSPLTSPLLNDAGCVRTDDEDEGRRKRFPTDKAYFIAKEVLTTERTYLKDLEVITVPFRAGEDLHKAVHPVHCQSCGSILATLPRRIQLNMKVLQTFAVPGNVPIGFTFTAQEGRSNAHIKGDYQRIGDVMLKNIQAAYSTPAETLRGAGAAGADSEVLAEAGGSVQGVRAAEGLLPPPQHLLPQATPPPHALQADPRAALQALPSRGSSALALCQFLENNQHQFNLRDKAVLELGAGTGLLSIVACLLGAWVTATDLPGVLGNLRMNLNRNTRGKCRYLPQVAELEWGSNLEEAYPKSVYRYEVVLAADVVYHHNCLDELLITMEHFCQPGTVLLWSNKYRFTTDHKFAEMFHNTFHTTLLAEFPDTEVKIFMATVKDKQ
ncbi:UNVERIFIED_CONTAM: hypothetical protein FKN15_003642 [Acipenser sinensis]